MSPSIDKLLFAFASGLNDAKERRVFLDRVCRDDPGLRMLLDELLEIQGAAEDFFEFQPEVAKAAAPGDGSQEEQEGLGAHIGRYRLIERIGAGGCGIVYLAEQLEPVRRKVALKIIRLGMNTESVIARFELERQALALMNHPNIARVLDAGATGSGRPYFVMELVDGERITEFCDANFLDIRQRLKLFVQVCQAIQHAHQKGIIHRDIKPSNILVSRHDGEPMPKVIDFGIAKAAAESAREDATFTSYDQFLGTPASMSPEQAEGSMDVDTRSDIYSLGVLLYELLTGRPPFDPNRLKGLGVDEVRRLLREDDPPPPSAALKAAEPAGLADIAGRRGTEVHRLVVQVAGDLDWIVMKAMEKDRQCRYDTASGLAMDVLRYLGDEPVLARPPSRGYRLRKLARRNKTVFAAGIIAVSGLVSGFGVSTWLFIREKGAREEQTRLHAVAEQARANEAVLRESAEFRERVAQAAVKIEYGNLEEANALLASIPNERVPPSLEAAKALQRVAQWHFEKERWNDGAERFVAVAHVIASADTSDNKRVSLSLLPAVVGVCYAGGPEDYGPLRSLLIERFGASANATVAEQILKSCLLTPMGRDELRRLEPLGAAIESAVNEEGNVIGSDPHLAAWSCFSLALLRYRMGEDSSASMWAERCLAYPRAEPAKIACGKILLAMIEQRAGREVRAGELRGEADTIMDGKFAGKVFRGGFGGGGGMWHDWITARILMDEALRDAGE